MYLKNLQEGRMEDKIWSSQTALVTLNPSQTEEGEMVMSFVFLCVGCFFLCV